MACGVVAGVLYLLAYLRYNQLHMACSQETGCDPSLNPSIDEGERFETMSWAFAGGAAALIVVGVIMIVVGGPHEAAPQAQARRTWMPLIAPAGAQGAVAGVGLRF